MEFESTSERPPPRRWWRRGLLSLAVVAFTGVSYLWWAMHRPGSDDATLARLSISRGQSSTAIGNQLASVGVIKNTWLFELYAAVTGQSGRLQAGEYELPKNLSLADVVKRLTQTQRRRELTLTVLEGWSNRELAEHVAQAGVTSTAAFFAVVRRKAPWWDEYEFLAGKPADRDLEGYLFPDTYRVFATAPVETLVRKMLDNFGRKLTPDLRAEIARQGKTLHEVLTLASIVEREVPDGPDRPTVAGIFLRRLAIGMPLQADATVNYVTGKKTPRASRDDIATESEYNTYIHRGLPPGPINNPGISGIRAALFPQTSPYLYYLTTPDGTVVYSRTYEEHVRAKARYYP